MDDYPDPEEEYEMLHEEEMEAMLQLEKESRMVCKDSETWKSKNSLNFDNVVGNDNINTNGGILNNTTEIVHGSDSSIKLTSKKRNLSPTSLMTITSDLEVVEPPVKKHKTMKEFSNEFGVTSFRVPNWPFMTIRNCEGEKLYVKVKQNAEYNLDLDSFKQKTKSRILVTPYSTLRTLIEESLKEKVSNSDSVNSLLEIENKVGASLWVDQFKPKTYFDLLSDEAINRTLLNWLKMWDKVVFNKEPKLKEAHFNKENEFKSDFSKKLDADGRPHFKISLLCGPPGLGKTTLAHIAASMTGYNVVEVNASDDRSIESLSSKLDNATQMQNVLGNCKPSCIILDEIDGAPVQTVEFLLKYLSGKHKETSKKGKKENVKILKRPVICICNDLYTPSLRQLRQQAFVVHFPNTSSSKLAQRLLEICRKQDIKTDISALTLLCDKAQNDIRSCISTLHFFKNQSTKRFKTSDVLATSMGLKDMQKSIFNIWKEIFYNPVQKKSIFSKALSKAVEEEVSSHVNYSKKSM